MKLTNVCSLYFEHIHTYIYRIIHRNPIETDSHFLSLNLIAAGGQSSSALTIQASCTDTTLTGMMFPIIVIVNYLLRKLCGYLRQSTSPPSSRITL